MSGVGLSGSQRVGKTTLAVACGKSFEIPVIKTSVSKVFKSMKLDPKKHLDFAKRLEVQWRILDALVAEYNQAGKGIFITDRTPIDFMAYLLSEVMMSNVTGELERQFIQYRQACFDVANNYFSVIIVVQPGIKVVECEGKASANYAHMELINTLVSGLSVSGDLSIQHTYIPRHVTDLARRVRCVEESLKIAYSTFERYAVKRGATPVSSLSH